MKRTIIIVLLLGLAGCAALPVPETGPDAQGDAKEERSNTPSAPLPQAQPVARAPAVSALLARARSQRKNHEYEQASISLERALRIDARDAELWLELAEARYALADFAASEQFADRARRLAGSDEAMKRKARQLAEAARSRRQ